MPKVVMFSKHYLRLDGQRPHLNGVTTMLFLKLCVFLTLLGIVDGHCTVSLWSHKTSYYDGPRCKERRYYMNGLQRDQLQQNDGLHLLTGASCCSAPSRFLGSGLLVHYQDWTSVLKEKNDIWANCPQGYFLHGLQISQPKDRIHYLHNIKYARCIKPSNHPHYYGDCYVQNINFNKKGVYYCINNYFITALHKIKGDYLHHIDKLYCCSMEEEPEIVYNVDTFKRVIMENTFENLVRLAWTLGYDYCAGTNAIYLGDHFYRDGDSWVANPGPFVGKTQRLKIDYLDWSFDLKDIIYGKSIIDELKPEKVYEFGFQNTQNYSITKHFQYKNSFSSSITHSTSTSTKRHFEFTLSMEADHRPACRRDERQSV